MVRTTSWRSVAGISAWLVAGVAGIGLVGLASIAVSGWLIDGVERANGGIHAAAQRSALGDYFGAVSAVFSGVALLLLVVTLLFQQRELRLQRQELALQREELIASRSELKRSADSDLRSLHVQLTQMQMADPTLAQVWNDWPGQSPTEVRQMLFANLTFSHYVLLYEWGSVTEAEMLAHARHLVRSPVFRRYWALSRESKAALPADTAEGRFFRLFDRAINESPGNGAPSPG
ncbi:hypothetical protein OK074_2300 [Actinobacteria bacterium OK074]|nr:hypothetical protein OK074_2300 [Actinobacteria bacterium OK074]